MCVCVCGCVLYVCFLQKSVVQHSEMFELLQPLNIYSVYSVCSCPSRFLSVQFLNTLSANQKWSIHVFSGFKRRASLSQNAFCYFGGFTRRRSFITHFPVALLLFSTKPHAHVTFNALPWLLPTALARHEKYPKRPQKQARNKQTKIKTAFGLVMHHQFASSCQTGSWVQNQREATVASKRCLSMSFRSDVCFLLCDVDEDGDFFLLLLV